MKHDQSNVVAQVANRSSQPSEKQIEKLLIQELPLSPMLYVECVTFGYFPNPEDIEGFDQLLLAASLDGDPRYVATIGHDEVPKKQRKQPTVMLSERQQDWLFVDTIMPHSRSSCRFWYRFENGTIASNGRLRDPRFVEVSQDPRKTLDFDDMNDSGDYSPITSCIDVDHCKQIQLDGLTKYEQKRKQSTREIQWQQKDTRR